MEPSVSPHGRKTQLKKNNTLNLSSVQLQIGSRDREREKKGEAKIERSHRNVREKMEMWGGGSRIG